MPEYADFARFYDEINGESESRSRKMLGFIDRYLPGATSVLELGCGTGAVLAGLGSGFALTGIDRSSEMLAVARRRCPAARFFEADMTSFDLAERFDVVLCVFDTLNHVANFAGWTEVFERVNGHLSDGGLFLFDLNTLGRLRRLGDAPPWVHDFDGNTLILDVEFDGEGLSQWDVRVFERRSDDHFTLCHERIVELGVPLDQVRSALNADFELVEETDPDGNPPTDESARAYFVYRRRSAPATR
jgi:SAM-dependent methyltransferase